MLSIDLEQSLHRALELASRLRHEFATLDHLLLALTYDDRSAAVLRACRINVDRLRADLTAHLDTVEASSGDRFEDSKPSVEFQHALQTATSKAQESDDAEVTTAGVLVAIIEMRARGVLVTEEPAWDSRLDHVHPGASGKARSGRKRKSGRNRRVITLRPPEFTMTAELTDISQRAEALAVERTHDYVTLEHWLLALTDESSAAEMLRAGAVDLDQLRTELQHYLDEQLVDIAGNADVPVSTKGVCRMLEHASQHVQALGRSEMTGADVVVKLFDERESHAVYCLNEQGMTRFDAVSHIAHGSANSERDGDA